MVTGRRHRTLVVMGLWACCLVAAGADPGLLRFTTVVRQSQGITIAEVVAGGEVLIRLRAAQGAQVAARAQTVAQRLHRQALQGVTGDAITVVGAGSRAQVRAGKSLLVAPDAQTARLSNTTVPSLAVQWAKRIATAFTPPYLVLDLHGELLVPVGERRSLRYGGHFSETVSAESGTSAVAAVSVDAANKMLIIEGKGKGNARVTVKAGALAGEFEVTCQPWAGQIKTFAEAHITGQNIPAHTKRQAAINAILAGATVAPGATASLPRLAGHDRLWKGLVVVEGEGYLRREQAVIVQHQLTPMPDVPPSGVLVSNKPEKVTAPAVLMRESLPAGHCRRVLWHHVNRGEADLTFALRLVNATGARTRVHILGDRAGPGRDEMYLGHVAMHRFWQALLGSTGYIATVPAGTIWNVFEQRTRPSQLISGMAQLINLGEADLLVELAAKSRPARLPLTSRGSRPKENLALSGFEYEAFRQVSVTHTIGGPWTFVRVGKRSGPDQLPGDYGVLYDIKVDLSNTSDTPGPFEISLQAAGGANRGLYLINGQLVATRVLRPNQEKTLYKGKLPAQATRTITIKTIPQSGSNYPVTLIVRSPRR